MSSEVQRADPEAPSQTPASTVTRRAYEHSLFRYLVIGVLSFAADAGTLYLTHGVFHIWLPLATTIAYALAFVVNFGLNRAWAFESSSPVGRQLTRYIGLVLVNYLLTLAIVTGLAALGVAYLLAKVIATGVTVALNYVAYRTWVFS